MFYVFHQNNNYGKYLLPAREVAIEADTYEGALEKMSLIPGVYFSDKSDKECACCAPRWSKQGYEYTPEEFALYIDERDDFMVWRSPKVPMMCIKYADDREVLVYPETPVHASDVPVDAPVPMPVEESAQECAAPIEGEVKDIPLPVVDDTTLCDPM
jgi:hypothetical protein